MELAALRESQCLELNPSRLVRIGRDITCSSFAHSPKSISLHFCEQKGLKELSLDKSAAPSHLGHLFIRQG